MGFITDIEEDVEEIGGGLLCPFGRDHRNEGHCKYCWEDVVAGLLQKIHTDLREDADASDFDIQQFSQANPVSGTSYYYPALPPAGTTANMVLGFPVDFRMDLLVLSIDSNAIVKAEIVGLRLPGSSLYGLSKVLFNGYINTSPVIIPMSQRVQQGNYIRFTATFSVGTPTLLSASMDLRELPQTNRNLFRGSMP